MGSKIGKLALGLTLTVAGVVGGVPLPSCLPHGRGIVKEAWAGERQVIGAFRHKWTGPAHFVIFSLRSVPYQAFSSDFSSDFPSDFSSNFSNNFSSDFSGNSGVSPSCTSCAL